MQLLIDFSRFLRENHLKALATENLKIAREINFPLMRLLEGKDENILIEMMMQSLDEFLLSIINPTTPDNQIHWLHKWETHLEKIENNNTELPDLVLIYATQKQALIKFISHYTADVKTASDIMLSLDRSYIQAQEVVFEMLLKTKEEVNEKIKKSEQLLEQAQSIAHIGSWEWLIDENQINWTKELYAIFELSPQEFDGSFKAFLKKVHTGDKDVVTRTINEALENGNPFSFYHRIVKMDHSIRTIHSKGEVIFNNEKPVKMLGTAQDITEHLIEEKKFQTLLESAPDAIILMNTLGNIVEWNRKAEKLFGWKRDEVIDRKLSTVIIPEKFREAHEKGMYHYLKTGEGPALNKQIELSALKKDAAEFPIELTISSVSIGNQSLFIGFIRDITARKKSEEKLMHLLERLEKKNKELNDFAYIVSHDLKAPLRAIGSLTNWLQNDYGEKFDEEGKQYIQLLIGRVTRMDSLIDGILQYSRIGKVKESEQEVNLYHLLKEVVDTLAPPPNIEVTFDTELPTVITGKISMIQIFQNLISNAINYMDKPQGKIDVGCIDEGHQWIFHVRDNGPGIEEKYFEKIFQIFQSLKARDEKESTGIGLAIVKKTIESYNGKIWVESEIGKGSTFYFTLPKNTIQVRLDLDAAEQIHG